MDGDDCLLAGLSGHKAAQPDLLGRGGLLLEGVRHAWVEPERSVASITAICNLPNWPIYWPLMQPKDIINNVAAQCVP